jgi:hypothetical protein
MHWKDATLSQLYEICYNDMKAALKHKIAAQSEIRRRRKKEYARKQYKEQRSG